MEAARANGPERPWLILNVGQEPMHFRITGDIDAKSGVGDIITSISGPTRKHFAARQYGAGLEGLVAVLMCQDPSLELKQRVRHSKKEKKLYVDVMLSLSQTIAASAEVRRSVVFHELAAQIGAILKKRRITDFDGDRFMSDLHAWLIAAPA